MNQGFAVLKVTVDCTNLVCFQNLPQNSKLPKMEAKQKACTRGIPGKKIRKVVFRNQSLNRPTFTNKPKEEEEKNLQMVQFVENCQKRGSCLSLVHTTPPQEEEGQAKNLSLSSW